MSIHISVPTSPRSIRKGKLFGVDGEILKKNEINRRRILRLEQVRQQSKDIANNIRQNIKGEKDKQYSAFERQQNAKVKKFEAQKLMMLQQQYQACLDEVGMGHKQAVMQPDTVAVLEAAQQRNKKLADIRGREADLKLKMEMAVTEEKKDALRKQQKFSRTVENLRSAMVTSLGKKQLEQTLRKGDQNQKPLSNKVKDVDQKFSTHELNCVGRCGNRTIYTSTVAPRSEHSHSETDSEDKPTQVEKRLVNSILSSDASGSLKSSENVIRLSSFTPPYCTSDSSMEVQHTKVQCYDHSNRFESSQTLHPRVERIFPHTAEPDANITAQLESQMFHAKRLTSDEVLYSRLRIRGQQALVREQLHRDHRKLLSDLDALAREERIIKSTHTQAPPVEIFLGDHRHRELYIKRQKNMDSAFESIYYGIQQDTFSQSSFATASVDSHQQEGPLQESPAKLNVAEWQPSGHTVNKVNVALSNRETATVENTLQTKTKGNTLQDLVKRINLKRSLLKNELTKGDSSLQGSLISHTEMGLSHFISSRSSNIQPSFHDQNCAKLTSDNEQMRYPDIDEIQHEKTERISDEFNRTCRNGQFVHKISKNEETEVNSLNYEEDGESDKENAKAERRKYARNKEECESVQVEKKLEPDINQSKSPENESVIFLGEHSFDMTGKGSESRVENSNSTSTSYEGVKIVVSVSELVEKKIEHTSSKSINKISQKSFKTKKHGKTNGKICKRKHKLLGKVLIEKERSISNASSCVIERETRTKREYHNAGEIEAFAIKDDKGSEEDKNITRAKWSDVINDNSVKNENSSEKSTMYLSPPDRLYPSHMRDLGSLLSTIQDHQKKIGEKTYTIDPGLQVYITQLLSMSRESVESLCVSTSEVSTPDLETSASVVTDTVPHRKMRSAVKKQTPRKDRESKVYTDFRNDFMDLRAPKEIANVNTRNKKHTYLKSDIFINSKFKKPTVGESKKNNIHTDLTDFHVATPRKKEMHTNLEVNVVTDTSLVDHNAEENPETKIDADLKADVTNGVEILTDIVRGNTKVTSIRMDHSSPEDEILHPQTTPIPSLSGSEAFRAYNTQIQSTPIPEYVHTVQTVSKSTDTNNVMDTEDKLHSSCRCEGNLCELDMQTPPFPSIIADMSLEEYKTYKFPEFFSNYAEKCSERISDLTKRIEEIRGEKTKLMASSNSSSFTSSSSSSASVGGFDSTKYLSPPEFSVVMTDVPKRDKGKVDSAFAEAEIMPSATLNKCRSEEKDSENIFKQHDDTGQKPHKELRPHSRPPPCLLKRPVVSASDAAPIKELSTIIEADTTQLSSSVRDTKEGSKIHEISLDNDNEDTLPDVMTEMLKRGLITSPLAWSKTVQSEESEMSAGSGSVSGTEPTVSRRKLSPFQYVDRDKFKEAVLESFVGKGTDTPEGIKVRKSIADMKLAFSQQVAETFAKLGKNPSRTDVKNAFKNLGLKWKARGRDQSLNPVISRNDLDPASEEFRQQVLESFVGLGLNSSPKDLEAAFRRLGLECPGGSLCICDSYELRQGRRHSVTPESSSFNSSNGYNLSSSASSTTLPPLPSSDSDDSDGNLSV